jgi:hypothetical protein
MANNASIEANLLAAITSAVVQQGVDPDSVQVTAHNEDLGINLDGQDLPG